MGPDKHFLIIFFLIDQGLNILSVGSPTVTADDSLNDLNDNKFPRRGNHLILRRPTQTESNQGNDHGRHRIFDGRIRLAKKFSEQSFGPYSREGIQKKPGGNLQAILTNSNCNRVSK